MTPNQIEELRREFEKEFGMKEFNYEYVAHATQCRYVVDWFLSKITSREEETNSVVKQVITIPSTVSNHGGWSKFETDDLYVVHLWDGKGDSFDITVPKSISKEKHR